MAATALGNSRPPKAPSAKGRVTATELWGGGTFSFFCHMGHRANIWAAHGPVTEACRAGADRPGRQKQRWLRSRTVVDAVVEDELAP